MAIKAFKCKVTEALFEGKKVTKYANARSVIERKLQQLDSAATLGFLRSPPGNRLEALSGDLAGRYSIRINDQFRICFVWTESGPSEVEIIDYH